MSDFNYELTYYIFIVLLSVVLAFNPQAKLSGGVKFSLFMIVTMCLSLVVRLSGFDADIAVYSEAMKYEVFSLYYLREPIVWLGQRAVFSFLGSELLVFFIFDFFVFVALYFSFRNYKVPYYAYFAFLCFFPFILGMQNVYRQWVSAIFCLLAFSFFYRNYFGRYLAFLLAGLSHNVAGVFTSAFLLSSKNFLEKLAGFTFLFITPLIVFYASGTKSSASTGQNLVVAYLGLLLFIAIFMALSSRLRIRLYERSSYLVICISVYVSFFAGLFLTSAGAERIAMYSLMLTYPHLINFFEWHYKQRFIFRFLIVLLGFVPLFLFGTRVFLI